MNSLPDNSHAREKDYTDRPRSLANPHEIAHRQRMLCEPHMEPLCRYVSELRCKGSIEIPDFDPMDGGVSAKMLFLLEKPGPMTSASGKGGSGFISRNNNDPTAEATFLFMLEAGIKRELSVLWNVIPGWNGTRKITAKEKQEGVESIGELLGLLPELRVIVCVGKKAASAKKMLGLATGIPVLESAHPSPLVRASYPERWHAIPTQWAQAKAYL